MPWLIVNLSELYPLQGRPLQTECTPPWQSLSRCGTSICYLPQKAVPRRRSTSPSRQGATSTPWYSGLSCSSSTASHSAPRLRQWQQVHTRPSPHDLMHLNMIDMILEKLTVICAMSLGSKNVCIRCRASDSKELCKMIQFGKSLSCEVCISFLPLGKFHMSPPNGWWWV